MSLLQRPQAGYLRAVLAGLPSRLNHLDLRAWGRTAKAGREAVQMVEFAVEEWDYDPDPLWWGADEYEVLVDVERGVMLQVISRLGG